MEKLNKNFVMGAIIGDIAGSRFEFNPIKVVKIQFRNQYLLF